MLGPDWEKILNDNYEQLAIEAFADDVLRGRVHPIIMLPGGTLVTTDGLVFRMNPGERSHVQDCLLYIRQSDDTLVDVRQRAAEQAGLPEGKIKAPVLIHKVEPVYPETAKEAGVSGIVMLTTGVDEKGTTRRVSAVYGSARPTLTEASIKAVSQWRYEPAMSSEGRLIPVSFGVIVRFLPDGTVDSEISSHFVEEIPSVEGTQ